MTAQAMVASAFTAPHVTEWVTVDVSATMELVERLRKDREFRDVKVTPLLVLAKAMCLALRRNPGVNASWDEAAQEIVLKHYVNLGIAAATPRGLVVPNVKDADRMSMREQRFEFAGKFREVRRHHTFQPAPMRVFDQSLNMLYRCRSEFRGISGKRQVSVPELFLVPV